MPLVSPKPLVEGAFSVALAVLLAFLGLYIPFMNLVWTIPITIMTARYSLRYGLMTLAVSTFLLILLANPVTAGLYVAQFGLVGVFFGWAFKRQFSAGYGALGGMLLSVGSTAVVFYLGLQLTGLTLVDLDQRLQSSVDAAFNFYRNSGILNSYAERGITEEMMRESSLQMLEIMKRLLPGMLAMGAAASAGLNYLLAHAVARRVQLPLQPIRPFSEWQLPWYLTWGVILGFAALLLGDHFQLSWLVQGGQNLLLIYSPFLLLFGIAVVSHYYHKSQLPRWFKIGIIVLSVLYFTITLIVLMTIGLFDSLFNYRKLAK